MGKYRFFLGLDWAVVGPFTLVWLIGTILGGLAFLPAKFTSPAWGVIGWIGIAGVTFVILLILVAMVVLVGFRQIEKDGWI